MFLLFSPLNSASSLSAKQNSHSGHNSIATGIKTACGRRHTQKATLRGLWCVCLNVQIYPSFAASHLWWSFHLPAAVCRRTDRHLRQIIDSKNKQNKTTRPLSDLKRNASKWVSSSSHLFLSDSLSLLLLNWALSRSSWHRPRLSSSRSICGVDRGRSRDLDHVYVRGGRKKERKKGAKALPQQPRSRVVVLCLWTLSSYTKERRTRVEKSLSSSRVYYVSLKKRLCRPLARPSSIIPLPLAFILCSRGVKWFLNKSKTVKVNCKIKVNWSAI